jgi:iron complex outermembrane receptor protein
MNPQPIATGARSFSRQDHTMTIKIRTKLVTACSAALLAAAADAQSLDYAGLEALFGEPVTMSVTGSPQRVSEVPASMTIITADDIRRSGARDVPGILSRVAGIDVNRTSSEHADVAVRGYNQAFTPRLLVLVDGRQVYADYYGFTPWSTIPIELEAIRQIEVVRGPSGALFGFNAVGGVVNIVTYDPLREPADTSVRLRSGTPDLLEVSAVSTFAFNDRAGLRLTAGSRRADEFSTAREAADIVVDRENRRDAMTADAHFSLRPNVLLGVELTMSAVDQIEMPPTYTLSLTEYDTRSIRTHWETDTGLGLVKANLYRNEIEADAYLAGSPDPIRRFDNQVLVAQIEDVFKVGSRHVLRVAGEYRDNSMHTTPIGGAKVFYEVLALTSMWNWRVTPTVSLTNAVRIDKWQLGREGFLPPEYVEDFGLTNEVWDISRDEISFNTGLVWQMSDSASLKFATGRARQLPNLLSLGGDFSEFLGFFFLGTPWLEPTNVSHYELDWERRLPEAGMRLTLGVFRGDTTDVQSTFFGNLGSSETQGLEALVSGDHGDRWGWDIGVVLQDVNDDLSSAFPAEFTLVDFERTTPERIVNGHVSWTRDRWEVDGYIRYESAALGLRGPNPGDFTSSLVAVPGHVAVDARLGYALGERVRLALTGRNLTRSSQRETSAPEVERQVFATFEYAF